MRVSRLSLVLLLFGVVQRAAAQVPLARAETATATAPVAGESAAPTPGAQDPVPPPGPPPPPDAPPVPPEPPPEPPPVPAPASAPAPEAAPSIAPAVEPPSAQRSEAAPGAPAKLAPLVRDEEKLPPFERAHSALTLDARLGMSWRPQGDSGFDDEETLGTDLGASLYWDFTHELAAGLEVARTSLGRGNALSGLDSISADYTAWSAMLGFRAYPKRSELLDVFVGIQAGVGVQGISATGTQNNGALIPASSYTCSGSDAPGFQLGGGVGARFMLAPRWGITARIDGTGRKFTDEVIDECARGLGTTTTVSGSLALGYDFDLDP